MLSRRGQTLGKIALKIKVVRPDGSPITTGQAWGRSLLRGIMIHVLRCSITSPHWRRKKRRASMTSSRARAWSISIMMEANVHCLNHFDSIEGLQHCARCGRVFCSDCLVRSAAFPIAPV